MNHFRIFFFIVFVLALSSLTATVQAQNCTPDMQNRISNLTSILNQRQQELNQLAYPQPSPADQGQTLNKLNQMAASNQQVVATLTQLKNQAHAGNPVPLDVAQQALMQAQYTTQQNNVQAQSVAQSIPNPQQYQQQNATRIASLQSEVSSLQNQLTPLQNLCSNTISRSLMNLQ